MKATWLTEDGTLAADPLGDQMLAANGVFYRQLETDPAQYQGPLDSLKAARGYVEQDEVALSPAMDNLTEICAMFEGEHFHDEDEVRFVIDGAGIFDIRSHDDRWMRVVVETGDLIVVPAKRHHRFFLTEAKTIRCVRLFKNASGWVPHYRDG